MSIGNATPVFRFGARTPTRSTPHDPASPRRLFQAEPARDLLLFRMRIVDREGRTPRVQYGGIKISECRSRLGLPVVTPLDAARGTARAPCP